MAKEHNWKVESCDYINKEGCPKAVSVIHWSFITKDEGVEDGPTIRTIGTHSLEDPDPNDFSDYADLTEETVLGWLPVEFTAEQEANALARHDTKLAAIAADAGTGLPWE